MHSESECRIPGEKKASSASAAGGSSSEAAKTGTMKKVRLRPVVMSAFAQDDSDSDKEEQAESDAESS